MTDPTRTDGQGLSDLSRRALLAAAGAVTLAAVAAPAASAADPVKVERTFEGASASGKLQEALDKALSQMDKALGEGGVRDALGSWKLAGVIGQRGGIAGLNILKVTITATRSPEWEKK